ncbi:MAG: T9SS type A sorting domain-containing protein [Candidatus Cloacimonetes bacterium]|nr:T9SS type A sorting domain-containing protein [Candidatus Cloacimonadota bacterium]MCF7813357.1 T9SS type A sorting domain-containing protein [Candidatus Cloacimonadota bacterium]MCF7867846.1 T9SS type A sorting domain-containing protein [Candidatus Cloacimonadota bacterium]MCF7883268.1 T9SS type A sorting domain-containing protein [Candidatus Cloacimonadota bacterium]
MHVSYNQSSSSTAYNYIYHSLDYGETFIIYNPIALGNEPSYAHFEASPTTGTAPLAVQFTNLSVGPINYWTWDFENDGVIDSDDQNPVHIYEEPGIYSIKLTIYTPGIGTEREAFRFDYITVGDSVSVNNDQINVTQYYIHNYPNPFNPSTTISFDLTAKDAKNAKIEIYNLKGQKVKTLPFTVSQSPKVSVIWNGTDQNNKPVSSGIYLYRLKAGDVDVSKKCLLLK